MWQRWAALPALRRALAGNPQRALWGGVALAALVAVVLASVLRAQWATGTPGTPGTAGMSASLVGRAAPAFALPAERAGSLLEQPVRYTPGAGQPTVLVFFFTLCTHCLLETKAIHDLATARAASGLSVVYVDSPGELPNIADMYAQRLGITTPILLDDDGAAAARYGVRTAPTVVFVDGAGTVRTVRVGEASDAQLAAAMDALLK